VAREHSKHKPLGCVQEVAGRWCLLFRISISFVFALMQAVRQFHLFIRVKGTSVE